MLSNNKGKIIIQGVDFTSLYNDYLFNPIKEHFPKAAAVATFPLCRTASKCMEKGSEIFMEIIGGIIKGASIPAENEFDKMVDQFFAEEDDLIKSFPTTYHTRHKNELRRYILDEIKAGILFWYEVAFTLNSKPKPEVNRA